MKFWNSPIVFGPHLRLTPLFYNLINRQPRRGGGGPDPADGDELPCAVEHSAEHVSCKSANWFFRTAWRDRKWLFKFLGGEPKSSVWAFKSPCDKLICRRVESPMFVPGTNQYDEVWGAAALIMAFSFCRISKRVVTFQRHVHLSSRSSL